MNDLKLQEAAERRAAWEKELIDAHNKAKSENPTARASPVVRAILQPRPSSMVRSNCWTCVGGDADPGGRARVRDCTVWRCAFWKTRPWRDVTAKSGCLDHPDNDEDGEDSDEIQPETEGNAVEGL